MGEGPKVDSLKLRIKDSVNGPVCCLRESLFSALGFYFGNFDGVGAGIESSGDLHIFPDELPGPVLLIELVSRAGSFVFENILGSGSFDGSLKFLDRLFGLRLHLRPGERGIASRNPRTGAQRHAERDHYKRPEEADFVTHSNTSARKARAKSMAAKKMPKKRDVHLVQNQPLTLWRRFSGIEFPASSSDILHAR